MLHDVRLLALLILFVASSSQGVDGIMRCCGYGSSQLKYAGAMATFDVYGLPNLEKGKAIGANIWVGDYINSRMKVQAGWEVYPDTYGDSKTHFYVYWTDGKDGCANLKCDGFVPVNFAPITPGDVLETSNGPTNVTLKIYKNKQDGDWWLYFGHDINKLSAVGYWPKSLVTNMQDRSSYVAWGGCAISDNGAISPPMGNGQWPKSDSAASFRNVQLVDTSGGGYDPLGDSLHAFGRQTCYQTGVFRFGVQGNMFYYGGPGGCTS
uniref:Uncharacterized protein n=1 Tax=Avena sativa TaxID=4498 RepID=A0ACD5XAL7_AVESA